jgi:hypothetical protein
MQASCSAAESSSLVQPCSINRLRRMGCCSDAWMGLLPAVAIVVATWRIVPRLQPAAAAAVVRVGADCTRQLLAAARPAGVVLAVVSSNDHHIDGAALSRRPWTC